MYVYRLVAGNWTQEARLTPNDAGAGDRFGQDLTFDGQDLIAGARRNLVSGNFRGAAYVHRQMAGSWTQVQKLVEPGTPGNAFTLFGSQVSASGGRLLVQGIGWNSEYFFTRDGSGVWGTPQRLPNPFVGSGQSFSYVQSTDLLGDRAISKATASDNSERLVSFANAGGTWAQVSNVAIGAPSLNMSRESPVGIAEQVFLAGAPLFDASSSALDQGAVLAYNFAPNATIGNLAATIWYGSGNIPDRAGSNTAMDGDWLATTAPGADFAGTDVEALYFFRRVAGNWQLAKVGTI